MTSPKVRALRGATTCVSDTKEEISEVTKELIVEMLTRNNLVHDDVISVIFTTSPDLTATFPATASRDVGFGDVPLMCASEIAVPGAKERCVRIMMHVYTTLEKNELHHIYLRDAKSLRDDLPS